MNRDWLDTAEIVRLALVTENVAQKCACASQPFIAWETVPITFPEELLRRVGTVMPSSDNDLTVKEYHPRGTHYWSPDAPIALHYFPANRSEVWQCTVCSRCFLRYTEFGGYYVDKRIRGLRASLLFTEPLLE